MKPVSAIVLAGGKGTRLRSVVADRPKVLATVAGRPFLSYLLDQLIQADVAELVISTGYMASTIQDEFGDRYKGVPVVYAAEQQPLGTGGAVRFAAEHARHGTLIVTNGDSFINVALAELLSFHFARGNDASLVLVSVPDTSRFGSVVVDDDDRVLEFNEKQDSLGSGLINGGIYVLEKSLLTDMPAGPSSIEKDLFPNWLNSSRAVRGLRTEAEFIDIGLPESYALSHQFMKSLQDE